MDQRVIDSGLGVMVHLAHDRSSKSFAVEQSLIACVPAQKLYPVLPRKRYEMIREGEPSHNKKKRAYSGTVNDFGIVVSKRIEVGRPEVERDIILPRVLYLVEILARSPATRVKVSYVHLFDASYELTFPSLLQGWSIEKVRQQRALGRLACLKHHR